MRVLFLTILVAILHQKCDSANILAIAPFGGKSHFDIMQSLLKALVARGHEVDVVSHFPLKTPIPRYNDLSIKGTLPIWLNNVTINQMKETNVFQQLSLIMGFGGSVICEPIFESKTAQDLRNSTKKYDLFIFHQFGTNCMLGFSHLFSIPTVAITTSVNLPWTSSLIGLPDNPSYIPNYFTSILPRMNFFERLYNTLAYAITKIGYGVYNKPSDIIAKRFFGSELPDLDDLARNISLVLVNSHFSIHQSRPTVPNFIEVAGMHIDENKTLTKYFEESLQTDTKGIIYLSFGSMVVSESFSEDVLKAFFNAFERLPYKVLWKASRERFPQHLKPPKNIQFEPWMPQMEILCHPNVKLFISHGGMLGTSEALYCAVPVLGVPLYADQMLNVRNSVGLGTAIEMQYKNITEDSLTTAINSLLNDPKYKTNTAIISRRFKDRPISAIDTAIYWVEYVIRHNGAPHLRSIAADLPFYQYYLIDVIAVFVLIGLLISFMLYKICVYILLTFFDLIRNKKIKNE